MKSEKTLGDIVCAIILIIFIVLVLLFSFPIILSKIIYYNQQYPDSKIILGTEWECKEMNAYLVCKYSDRSNKDLIGEITVGEKKYSFTMSYKAKNIIFEVNDYAMFSGNYRVNKKGDIIIKDIEYYYEREYLNPELKEIVFKKIEDTSNTSDTS